MQLVTRDGLRLDGTLVAPEAARQAAVLVHGGGVTREEAGFFARLADSLAGASVASLRFDLRGHGESEGRQEDITLTAILNDVAAAVSTVRAGVGVELVALIGTSFSGGICGYYAAIHQAELSSLVLLNPLLNYKKRFIDDKPYWRDDQIQEDAARELMTEGFLAHSPTFKLGRPLLNEIFYLEPQSALGKIHAPTLIVHGTKDTFIPIASSRWAAEQLTVEHRLIEVDGAQHGFAVRDDPTYAEPQTQRWQAFVIASISDWITSHDDRTAS